MPVSRQIASNRENPGVVLGEPKTGRKHRRVSVVQFYAQRSAEVVDLHRNIEAPMSHAQVIEQSERGAGEIAEFGVRTFGLEFTDDDDRQHDLVLVESQQRARVAEQHAGVEHVGMAPCDTAGIG